MAQKLSLISKITKILKTHWSIDIAAIILTIIFIIAGLIVSINRFWQYEVFYYNFGVFDQAIWHISRFQPPIIEHLLVGGKISLADHFDLSILLLAPVFWFTDKSEALLVIQSLFAGLAGFVIYKIGIEILKDKFLSFAIACCYFFFVGIQNAVITDFQELTVMTFPITLTFYAIIKKKIKLFWILFLLTLGFKEVTFLLGIGIAIYILFYNRRWKWHAFSAILISALWGFITIKIVIPYFSQGLYLHQPNLPDSLLDKAMALIDHPIKRHTLFFSFLNFGFLPLFSPSMWAVILQDYIQRFLPLLTTTYWGLGLHYNAVVSPLLSIASIFGFNFIQKFKIIYKIRYIIGIILIINTFVLFRFILHGPFMLAINPVFYRHTSDFKFLDKAISKIPNNVSIMTQNNLGVRFDHQKYIYPRENYDRFSPDYILIDARSGQNPNNYLFSPPPAELLVLVKRDDKYKLIYHEGDQYIFKKKGVK